MECCGNSQPVEGQSKSFLSPTPFLGGVILVARHRQQAVLPVRMGDQHEHGALVNAEQRLRAHTVNWGNFASQGVKQQAQEALDRFAADYKQRESDGDQNWCLMLDNAEVGVNFANSQITILWLTESDCCLRGAHVLSGLSIDQQAGSGLHCAHAR